MSVQNKTPFVPAFPTWQQLDACTDFRQIDTWLAQFLLGWDDCSYKSGLGMAVGIPPDHKHDARNYQHGVAVELLPMITQAPDVLLAMLPNIIKQCGLQEMPEIHFNKIGSDPYINSCVRVAERQKEFVGRSTRIGAALGIALLKMVSTNRNASE